MKSFVLEGAGTPEACPEGHSVSDLVEA